MKEEVLKIIDELIKEYEPKAIPPTYDDCSKETLVLLRLKTKVSQMQLPVKPEICVHISKIDSGGSFIDSERLSKRFTEYNLIPQLETKINLISEDGQYLEQFEVIQIYYEVDKKLKIDIYLDEY